MDITGCVFDAMGSFYFDEMDANDGHDDRLTFSGGLGSMLGGKCLPKSSDYSVNSGGHPFPLKGNVPEMAYADARGKRGGARACSGIGMTKYIFSCPAAAHAL